MASMLLAPSLTPWRARITGNRLTAARNPGIRLVKMTSDYTRLLDVEQYYLPLTEANKQKVDEWKLEYSFQKTYNMEDATTESLHGLLDEFKAQRSEQFEQYHMFNTVNAQTKSNVPCDCVCRNQHLCAIEHLEYEGYSACTTKSMCSGSSTLVITSGLLHAVGLLSSVLYLTLFTFA